MLNESLGMSDLSGSPMCIHGMKVLTRASENGGIKLTKSGAFYRQFVRWAAEEISGSRDSTPAALGDRFCSRLVRCDV